MKTKTPPHPQTRALSLFASTKLLSGWKHPIAYALPMFALPWMLCPVLGTQIVTALPPSGIRFQVSSERPSLTDLTLHSHSVMPNIVTVGIILFIDLPMVSLSFSLSPALPSPPPTRMSAPYGRDLVPFECVCVPNSFNKSYSCPLITCPCLNHQVMGWTVSHKKLICLSPNPVFKNMTALAGRGLVFFFNSSE